MRQPPGPAVPFGWSRACAHVHPTCTWARTLPSRCIPASVGLPFITSFPLLLTHCRTPCDLGLTFGPGFTGFPGFPATFHLHSAPIQCIPSPSPPPVASLLLITLLYQRQSCQPSLPSHVPTLLERQETCYDFWGLQGVTGCWFDPWQQGLGGGSCCGPGPLWLHWGMLAPQTAPKPGTARTKTGPGDVVSGILTKTQQLIVLLTHPHGHNCAGRARRAPGCCMGGAAARTAEPLPLSPLTPKGGHWVCGTLGSFPEPV